MSMTIDYYIAAMIQQQQNERSIGAALRRAYTSIGAIGFAYLNGQIGVAEWTRLTDAIRNATLTRLSHLEQTSTLKKSTSES